MEWKVFIGAFPQKYVSFIIKINKKKKVKQTH